MRDYSRTSNQVDTVVQALATMFYNGNFGHALKAKLDVNEESSANVEECQFLFWSLIVAPRQKNSLTAFGIESLQAVISHFSVRLHSHLLIIDDP